MTTKELTVINPKLIKVTLVHKLIILLLLSRKKRRNRQLKYVIHLTHNFFRLISIIIIQSLLENKDKLEFKHSEHIGNLSIVKPKSS